jgi:NMDA receptor-regulated protein 1
MHSHWGNGPSSSVRHSSCTMHRAMSCMYTVYSISVCLHVFAHVEPQPFDCLQSLKMFRAVLTHFDEFREDQRDFHGYCLRKATLRAYTDMLHMEDAIYSAQAYRDAALGAIQCYISLHDSPPGGKEAEAERQKMQDMTEAQKKKFLEKKKKEAAKVAKAEAEKLEKERAAHNAKKNAGKFDEVCTTTTTYEARLPMLVEHKFYHAQISCTPRRMHIADIMSAYNNHHT